MNRSVLRVGLALGVVAAVVQALLVTVPRVEAQRVTGQVLAQYLERTGVSWKRDDKDPNVFHVTKTTGLKKAERIEIVISNIPERDLVTLRAFPKTGGKYLALAGARNTEGLMKNLLQNNAMAFGAYFVDSDGDIGFRYVFTTESGLGYESFKVATTELLRIADAVMIDLYNKYR